VALGLLPRGWAHPLRTRSAWAMPHCWAYPSTHNFWALASVVGIPLRTRGVWALTSVLGTPLHTCGAWAVYLGAGHTPAHTWRSGTPRPNFPWAPHVAKPKIVLGHWLCRAQNRFGSCMCRTRIALGPAIVRDSIFMQIKGEPAA